MARRRWIDPSFWDDLGIAKLDAYGRLFFIGCFSNGDDDGRLIGNPAYLRALIFKYDDRTLEEIKDIRDTVLSKMKNLRLYSNAGEEYLAFNPNTWKTYQNPRHYKPSKLPPPPDDLFEQEDGQRMETGRPMDAQRTATGLPMDGQRTADGRPEDALGGVGVGGGGVDTPSKVSKDTLSGASFDAWLERIQNNNNKPAALFEMIQTLFSKQEFTRETIPRLGKMLKNHNNDWGDLARLVWIASSERPAGDPLSWIQGKLRGGKKPRSPPLLPTAEEIEEGTKRFLEGG